jgi:uncharacterized membrane protein YgdD (TMEM256/DUF423 family)
VDRFWLGLAAVSGAAAVAAEAIARHALAGDAVRGDWVAIGGRYGLIHAVALLVVAALARDSAGTSDWLARRFLAASGWCFAAGLVLFPGSLYLRALDAPVAVARLTPIGGTLFIIGWLALLAAAVIGRRSD